MGKSICFTGHRQIPKAEIHTLLERLRRLLCQAIADGFSEFYCGGAVGWDTYCGIVVLELQEMFPHIALHLVLPCPPEEQSARFTEHQKTLYYRVYAMANTREIVCPSQTKNCMQRRNQRLVDQADCCICYCRENGTRTGTAQTMRMARRKGIPIINVKNQIP